MNVLKFSTLIVNNWSKCVTHAGYNVVLLLCNQHCAKKTLSTPKATIHQVTTMLATSKNVLALEQ